MFHRILVLLLMTTVIANQAMAYSCHVHEEQSEFEARPHFHLNVFAHGHVHDHHHSHHHGHSHDGASKEIPASHDLDGFVTEHPHHDSDAIYIADTDVVLEKRVVQVQFTPVVHFLSPGSGFTAIDACARRLLIPESRPSFAAALSLRKIRLLL